MKRVEGRFQGKEGLELYYQGWLPGTEARAVLVIAHGVAEHCGRYQKVADYFVHKDYAVYLFDYRGHGKSQGKRGYVERFSYYVDDLHTFLNQVRRQNPGKKVFLFGHSMGATLGLAYAVEHQSGLDGLILSGTAVRLDPRPPVILTALLPPLSVLVPRLGLRKLDSSTLSHDPQIVRSYDTDPLVFRGKLSVRLVAGLLRTMHGLESQVSPIRLPVLFVHGGADKLSDPEGARIVFARISSQDKTLKMYSGLYHEILNEPEYAVVLADIEAWLDRHSSPAAH